MSNKKISFKQFLEGLDFDFDALDSEGDDQENIDLEDDEKLNKLTKHPGGKTNQGIKSDKKEIPDATQSAARARKAGF